MRGFEPVVAVVVVVVLRCCLQLEKLGSSVKPRWPLGVITRSGVPGSSRGGPTVQPCGLFEASAVVLPPHAVHSPHAVFEVI